MPIISAKPCLPFVWLAGAMVIAIASFTASPVLAQKAGQPAAGQARKPVRTEIRNVGNWKVTCEEYAGGKSSSVCTASLKIVERKTGRTLFA